MIQIDMPMPKCCDECFALDDHGDYPFCMISKDQRGYNFNTRNNKMPSCPLKSQEPRLLTLDEIHDSVVVWLEAGTKFLKIVDDDGVVLAIGGSERMGAKCFITVWDVCIAAMNDDYNVTWRAWSERPTVEQRRGTPWE